MASGGVITNIVDNAVAALPMATGAAREGEAAAEAESLFEGTVWVSARLDCGAGTGGGWKLRMMAWG